MTLLLRRILLSGLLLTCMGIGLPRLSYGSDPSCTNSFLTGTYNAEITSLNFTNVLTALSASGVTGAVSSGRGLGNNPASLSGIIAGSGRYYFDGVGNIWGRQPGSSAASNLNIAIGSYDIGNDCRGSLALSTGEHYNIVVVGHGVTALFLQTDAGSGGSVGQLDRAVDSCIGPNSFPAAFGFSFFGARTATAPLTTFAAIGDVNLLDNGEFTLNQWLYNAGTVQAVSGRGTYTLGADCGLRLTFAPDTTGVTAVNFTAPTVLRGALNRTQANPSTGVLSVQPSDMTIVLGRYISQ